MRIRPVLASLLTPFLCLMQGCHAALELSANGSYTFSGPGAGNATAGGGVAVNFYPNVMISNLDPTDAQSIADGSNVLSLTVPASGFSSAAGQTATTMLSAATDTGYSSAISLPLSAAAPATSPAQAGDAVYSFNLPASSALSSWLQNVVANTNSTMTLQSSASLPLSVTASLSSFTATSILTSNSVGKYTVLTMTVVRPSTTPCTGHVCPVQP